MRTMEMNLLQINSTKYTTQYLLITLKTIWG